MSAPTHPALAGEMFDLIQQKIGEISDLVHVGMYLLAAIFIVSTLVRTRSAIKGLTATLVAAVFLAAFGSMSWLADKVSTEFSAPAPVVHQLHPQPPTPAEHSGPAAA